MAASDPDTRAARGGNTLGVRLGYASGNLGKNVLASTMDFFLLYLLTERWGVAPERAGWVIMAGLVWDGLCDPLLGRLIDRAPDRLRVYRRSLVLGAPVVGLFFALFFLVPRLGAGSVLGYAIAMVLLFRTAFSVCDVAHNALLVRLVDTPREATLLSVLRYMFSCLGALAIARVSGVFVAPDADGGHALLAVTVLAAASYVVTLWLSAVAVRGRIEAHASARPSRPVAWLWGNRPLMLLFLVAGVQALTLPLFARSIAYVAKGVVRDAAWTGAALSALTVAQLVALPVWFAVARSRGKRAAMTLSLATILVGLLTFAGVPGAMLAGVAIFGFGNAGLQAALWATLPDAIAWGERRTGVRFESLPVSIFLLLLKASGGLSGALLGHGLHWIGWSTGQGGGTALLALACGVPIAGCLACLLILLIARTADAESIAAPAAVSASARVRRVGMTVRVSPAGGRGMSRLRSRGRRAA